jgi:hypothetical protein
MLLQRILDTAVSRGQWKPLLLGVVIAASGCSMQLLANSQLTPKSISVSGYTRIDGTRVSAHSRRPPGSKDQDWPYELLAGFGLLIAVGGAIGTSVTLRQVWIDTPGPPVRRTEQKRVHDTRAVIRLTSSTGSDDLKTCSRCQRPIAAASTFWYLAANGPEGAPVYCNKCSVHLRSDLINFAPQIGYYDEVSRQLHRFAAEHSKQNHGASGVPSGSRQDDEQILADWQEFLLNCRQVREAALANAKSS